MFDTPILYLIFNRPNLVEITFSAICEIKPKKLFIAADGPRLDNLDDVLNCMLARQYVLSKIDWECDVKTLFRDTNYGCGIAVSSAISWFFEDVEEGIILEDDCLADKSFFNFCALLLNKYRSNHKILHINGSNHQFGIKRGFSDYYYSVYPHIWGWATWKRAWNLYDFKMSDFRLYQHKNYFKKYAQISLMMYVFNSKIDTWDIQWVYSVFKYKGLVITPNINLITNVGFDENATHTTSKVPEFIKKSKLGKLNFPMKYPVFKFRNLSADRFTAVFVHDLFKPTLMDRLLKKALLIVFRSSN